MYKFTDTVITGTVESIVNILNSLGFIIGHLAARSRELGDVISSIIDKIIDGYMLTVQNPEILDASVTA